MDQTTLKQRISDLYKGLRDSNSTEADMTVELIRLLYEKAKDDLVNSADVDMMRAQGRAQMLKKIYQELTTAPPQLRQE